MTARLKALWCVIVGHDLAPTRVEFTSSRVNALVCKRCSGVHGCFVRELEITVLVVSDDEEPADLWEVN